MGRSAAFGLFSVSGALCLVISAGGVAAQTPPPAQPPAPSPLRPGAVPATKAPAGAAPDKAAEKPAREPNAGGYKLKTGPVMFTEVPNVALKDAARGKDVEVRVRYSRLPENKGPYPVVIVSHGAGGSSMAFNDLCRLIASHGYIVISPTHSDSIRQRRKNNETMGVDAAKEVEKLAEKVDPLDRLADVKLVLDSMDYLADFVPDLKTSEGKSKMDPARVAVLGHSAGAFTAQLAMNVRVRRAPDSEEMVTLGDARIKAGVLISPQSTGSGVLFKDSWAGLALPTLVVCGTQESTGFTKETPQTRREPFDFAPPGDKYLLLVQGATHSSFAGRAAASAMGEKPETEIGTITDTLASGVMAFLDAYLKDDAAGRAYLAGDGIPTVSTGKATVERK